MGSMGVKFAREYEDIVRDLSEAIQRIDSFYEFFYMSDEDWGKLPDEEQQECIKTLADDIFFALGSSKQVEVGEGSVRYNSEKHILKVQDGRNIVTVVNLV